MKKFVSVIVALLLLMTAFVMPVNAYETTEYDYRMVHFEDVAYSPGDVNGDRALTMDDAKLCLRAALGLEKLDRYSEKAADVFHNGKITAKNARTILRAAVKLEYLLYDIVDIELGKSVKADGLTSPTFLYEWYCEVLPEDKLGTKCEMIKDIRNTDEGWSYYNQYEYSYIFTPSEPGEYIVHFFMKRSFDSFNTVDCYIKINVTDH